MNTPALPDQRSHRRARRGAFTLVEMLLVITIILAVIQFRVLRTNVEY